MRKKKSSIKLNKSPSRKVARKRFKKSNYDDDDYSILEADDTLNEEEYIDEFERSQDLPSLPGTLHHLIENEDNGEDEENEENEEGENEEIEGANVTSTIDDDLNARGNKNKHYVRPVEFEAQIENYYKEGILTDELCEGVYKIANRLSYRPNFVNYSFREEMVGDAIERMIFALNNRVYKYNPDKIGKNGKKGNAFLYFTKIAENAFINRIKIEARNREAISKYQEDVYQNLLQKGIDTGSNSRGSTDT